MSLFNKQSGALHHCLKTRSSGTIQFDIDAQVTSKCPWRVVTFAGTEAFVHDSIHSSSIVLLRWRGARTSRPPLLLYFIVGCNLLFTYPIWYRDDTHTHTNAKHIRSHPSQAIKFLVLRLQGLVLCSQQLGLTCDQLCCTEVFSAKPAAPAGRDQLLGP